MAKRKLIYEENISSDELSSDEGEAASSFLKGSNNINNNFNFSSDEEIVVVENERNNSSLVKNIFDEFGQQITKAMQMKKMKFENSFEDVSKKLNEKLSETLENENKKRRNLLNKRRNVIKQKLESWIDTLEDFTKEEKQMQMFYEHYLEISMKCRAALSERIKVCLRKNETFFQVDQDMEEKQSEEFETLKNNLKKKLEDIKNKIKNELRNEEMTNMKKSLESLVNF